MTAINPGTTRGSTILLKAPSREHPSTIAASSRVPLVALTKKVAR